VAAAVTLLLKYKHLVLQELAAEVAAAMECLRAAQVLAVLV
jgi:hypothetical protein